MHNRTEYKLLAINEWIILREKLKKNYLLGSRYIIDNLSVEICIYKWNLFSQLSSIISLL